MRSEKKIYIKVESGDHSNNNYIILYIIFLFYFILYFIIFKKVKLFI